MSSVDTHDEIGSVHGVGTHEVSAAAADVKIDEESFLRELFRVYRRLRE